MLRLLELGFGSDDGVENILFVEDVDEFIVGAGQDEGRWRSRLIAPTAVNNTHMIVSSGQIRSVENATASVRPAPAVDRDTFTKTISCASQYPQVELLVNRKIGSARGEANIINRLALTGGALTLLLIGVPGIISRSEAKS